MDDCGITNTNDPSVRVVWEREGNTIHLALDIEPASEPGLCWDLPQAARPA